MKQNRRFTERVSKIIDMSAQQLPGVPIVELTGTKRVLIENHKGVITYTDALIRICVAFGIIEITGNDLEICHMSRQQLVIKGTISCVQVERGLKE